jgi:hypothetical protein
MNPLAVQFDECDGLNRIERLQSYPNTKVYDGIVQIIETHFGVEEEN